MGDIAEHVIDIVASLQEANDQIRERDERIRKLEGMLKVYASGHHDDTHVGRGAEDYTDCPEQICIDACDALGYALVEG